MSETTLDKLNEKLDMILEKLETKTEEKIEIECNPANFIDNNYTECQIQEEAESEDSVNEE